MKKLMFAAAVAACVSGVQAADCAPDAVEVARVYQIQLNTYTTCGHAVGSIGATGGSQCAPGEAGDCLVLRGKDKTVIRGYVYVCNNLCDVQAYKAVLADVRRCAFFKDGEDFELSNAFEWKILNIMGSQMQDAEAQWKLTAIVNYGGSTAEGDARVQEYELIGAGYGKFNHTDAFFDNFGGYFAGVATPSFDLKTRTTSKDGTVKASCACDPSMVLTCEDFGSDEELVYEAVDTVAFGVWKMKYNHNLSKALWDGKWDPVKAIQKLFK